MWERLRKETYELYKVTVLPDLHIPYHDKKTWQNVLKYLRDFKPNEIVLLGDFLDFSQISSHNRENLKALTETSLDDDYRVGNQCLDELQAVQKKITFISGNHDYLVNRFIDAFPQLKGSIEVPLRLNLKERGVKYVPFWESGAVHKIGKATFIHGYYTNDGHAKKHLSAWEENVFYGHLHDTQSYSKTNNGSNKTKIAQSLGCLCDYRQYWMKGRPSRWQQAFGEFHFREDGFFNYYVVNVFNHGFVAPSGKWYGEVVKKKGK